MSPDFAVLPPDPSVVEESRFDPTLQPHAQPEMALAGGGAGPAVPLPAKPVGQTVRRRTADTRDPGNPATWGKVPRNAPCPCGSGKKYKRCHGKAA